jgi:hypothetical protein
MFKTPLYLLAEWAKQTQPTTSFFYIFLFFIFKSHFNNIQFHFSL